MTFSSGEDVAEQGWSLCGLQGSKQWSDWSDFAGTNHVGSVSAEAQLSGATNTYGMFRSLTALRQARLEFYIGRLTGNPISDTLNWYIQLDDGDKNDALVDFSSVLWPANFISIDIDMDDSGLMNIRAKYEFNSSGSFTNVHSFQTTLSLSTSTSHWFGIRIDLTDTAITISLDTTDNGIFELFDSATWTTPFSGTPFNNLRISIDTDGESGALDSIDISSLTTNSGNQITNINTAISANKLDGEGVASFVYVDYDYSDLATIQALMLLDCIYTDDNTDTVFFNGQFVEWDFHPNGFVLHAVEGINKARKYQANFNPVRLSGSVGWIDDTEIRNENINFTGNNGFPILIEDVSNFVSHAQPKTFAFFSDDGVTPFTPKDGAVETEQGDVNNLSIFDANFPRNSIGTHALGAYAHLDISPNTSQEFIMQLDSPMYYKENGSISFMKLNIVFSFSGTNAAGDRTQKNRNSAKIEIYNYDSASWETLETFGNADLPGDKEKITATNNHIITTPATRVYTTFSDSTLNNYKDTAGEGAANSSGFIETNFRFRLQAYDGGIFSAGYSDIWVHEAFFELTWDTEQTLIVSSSTTSTTADNTTTLSDNLEIEGVTKGDNISITETVTDILDNVWTQSGISTLYTLDRDTDGSGDNEDLTYKTVYYVLRKYKDLGYYFWQYDDTVRMKKTFISSGLTLTEADIYNYANTRLGLKASYRNMRNEIILIGQNNINIPKSVSPDVANVFVELIERSDVKNQSIAQGIVDNIATTFYAEPNYFGSLVLNWDKPSTDYSAARVGTTIAYTDTKGILDFSSGGTTGEELIITELHTFRQKNKNLVKLIVTLNAE